MSVERPYQVCLYVGPTAPLLEGVRVVNLTPAEHTAEAVVDTLKAADLTPADLRSRVLFLADGDDTYRNAAVMTYAALLGFAKRRLDVAFSLTGTAASMESFDSHVRATPGLVKPDVIPDTAQVGGALRVDLPHVSVDSAFTRQAAALIRFARRLRFVPPASTALAVQQLVAVAALRARGQQDKLPMLCTGDEPAPASGVDAVGIDLDGLRRAGEDIRRGLRSDTRDAVAPKLAVNPFERLLQADAVPVEQTLVRLGAKSRLVDLPAKPGTPEAEAGQTIPTEVWHCPRPERHTNGDANPSSRVIVKNDVPVFQCFRCDPERVGSLRLVMDTKGMTGAEAANWLLGTN